MSFREKYSAEMKGKIPQCEKLEQLLVLIRDEEHVFEFEKPPADPAVREEIHQRATAIFAKNIDKVRSWDGPELAAGGYFLSAQHPQEWITAYTESLAESTTDHREAYNKVPLHRALARKIEGVKDPVVQVLYVFAVLRKQGRETTPEEVQELLHEIGFFNPQLILKARQVLAKRQDGKV